MTCCLVRWTFAFYSVLLKTSSYSFFVSSAILYWCLIWTSCLPGHSFFITIDSNFEWWLVITDSQTITEIKKSGATCFYSFVCFILLIGFFCFPSEDNNSIDPLYFGIGKWKTVRYTHLHKTIRIVKTTKNKVLVEGKLSRQSR